MSTVISTCVNVNLVCSAGNEQKPWILRGEKDRTRGNKKEWKWRDEAWKENIKRRRGVEGGGNECLVR